MERKFGVKDQVGYFFGDFAGSLVNIYIDSYFLVFCTYVLGISPYFMGILFFGSKVRSIMDSRSWFPWHSPVICR